ncbi:MAG TPA: PIN domain-containing protein [Caulobacteraceae bacterium]
MGGLLALGWRARVGSLIHLDTHVVIWTASKLTTRLSPAVRRLFERDTLQISPVVAMELETLFEARKLGSEPEHLLSILEREHALTRSEARFDTVIGAARTFAWTRDPFDRLIVANAMADGVRLVTADETILTNFKDAVW